MRPRNEVILTTLGLTAILAVAGVLSRREAVTPQDEVPSMFLTGPNGSRALFDAALKLGVSVRRFRGRPSLLPTLVDTSRRQLLVVLGTTTGRLSAAALSGISGFGQQGDLLLAGQGASGLMRCYGYRAQRAIPLRIGGGQGLDSLGLIESLLDSIQAVPPGQLPHVSSPWIRRILTRSFERTVVDSSRAADASRFTCVVPAAMRVDTLLLSANGDLVAVRLHLPGSDRAVVLASDEGLFRNRAMRNTSAGEFALGLLVGRYDQVIFEENHLGFEQAGSLLDAVWRWSKESPWGWAAWQLAGLGIIALLFNIGRFGAARPAISRVRRSSLEHVLALATALAAAKGHDEAIAAIVRGLRRRLSPGGVRSRGDWREWLADMERYSSNPRQTELVSELRLLILPGQASADVLRAANLVEDLWQHLRP